MTKRLTKKVQVRTFVAKMRIRDESCSFFNVKNRIQWQFFYSLPQKGLCDVSQIKHFNIENSKYNPPPDFFKIETKCYKPFFKTIEFPQYWAFKKVKPFYFAKINSFCWRMKNQFAGTIECIFNLILKSY